MQVTLNPSSAAEVRLIAAFMNDLADLLELETEKLATRFRNCTLGSAFGTATPAAAEEAAPTPAEEVTVKKSRAKKTPPATTVAEPEESTLETKVADASTATEPDTSCSEEEPGNEPAATAETPVESGSPETAEPVTHDTLRKLYGDLVTAGKRDEVVKAVKSFGVNAIKDIPADKLYEVHAAMLAVK